MKVRGRLRAKTIEIIRPVVVEAFRQMEYEDSLTEAFGKGVAEQAAYTQAWLEEQCRAGRIVFLEDSLEMPVLDEKEWRKRRKRRRIR